MNSIANELRAIASNWYARKALDKTMVQLMREKTYEQCADELSALADRISSDLENTEASKTSEQEDKARAAVNEMTRIAQENGEYGKSDIFEVDRICGELSDIFLYTGGAIGKTCDEARDMIRDLYEAAMRVGLDK